MMGLSSHRKAGLAGAGLPHPPGRSHTPLWLALAAVLLVIGLGGALLGLQQTGEWSRPAAPADDLNQSLRQAPGTQSLGPKALGPQALGPSTPATLGPAASGPAFDVVRVSPDGGVVIAGHAQPGAEVTIRDGAKEIGRAQADSQGAWVFIAPDKLPAGPQELTLSARPLGGEEVAGKGSVLLVVPGNGLAGAPTSQGPLAVLTTPAGPPRVLQRPGARRPGAVGLDALEYDQRGQLRFSGHAPPGATVRLYVDNKPVGQARAGADGAWTLTPAGPVATGQHQLRLDQLSPAGRVVARIELPFQRENLAAHALAPGSMIIQPGQNLWRIARQTYGAGIRYTVIYEANHEQIRDPNRIYPGQVFRLPDAARATGGLLEPAR